MSSIKDTQSRVEVLFKEGLTVEQIATIVGWKEERTQSFCEGIILKPKESDRRLQLALASQEEVKQQIVEKKIKRIKAKREMVDEVDGHATNTIKLALAKVAEFIEGAEISDLKEAEHLVKLADSVEKMQSRLTQSIDQCDIDSLDKLKKSQMFEVELHKTTREIHEESTDGMVHLKKGKRPRPRVVENSERRIIRPMGASPLGR